MTWPAIRSAIGIGVGTYGVMGAFSKGAPLRIIGSSMTGAHDLYWYAKADGPIKTIKDAAGKTVAYSHSVAAFRRKRDQVQAVPWRNGDKRLRCGKINPSRGGSSPLR